MSIFKKILGDANEKMLKSARPLVDKINQLEPQFEKLSDEQLKQKTEEFKKRLKEKETLDDILAEAFANVREAAKRTLGQRHYDVQLIGGIVLHQGKIAEMKTGEGKTLAATLAVYLNALSGRGVHVVTVNDYLARRDTNWMGAVYHLLGLSCACLNHEKSYLFDPQVKPDENEVTVEMENLREVPRKDAYNADITYGTNNEFGFDYLRDNMAPTLEMMVQRYPSTDEASSSFGEARPYFAIVDEVDSILIDEARTPLIISMPDAESTKLYEQFAKIVPQLKENVDYNIDEKMRTATLTEDGIAKVEKILGLDNIYQEGGIRYVHHLEQALRAQVLFIRDRHYVVKNNQVIIVDDFTGRLMPGRRYSDGLHQALEAKEGVVVQQESRTLASITFQNYFRMYEKLSGMTGTAVTSAEEFNKVYKLDVVVIPTNKPLARQDLPDSIYRTEKGKLQAIVREIKKRHQADQPILIGTVSIEKNELLSSYLKKEGIPHQILNAKYHEQEAQIIAQAGRKGAVTVATNMAGRGVDIVLGGRSDGITSVIASSDAKRQGRSNLVDNNGINQEHNEVVKAGGLCVIGTERHEARRIDDQLRGRSGRQGDPGSSQFFVSLEDDLMRIFGGEKIKSMMTALKVPEDQPIENRMISKAIESAQAKIEGYNFDARKHVLEYDDVMNKQREVVYKKRREALTGKNLKPQVLGMVKDELNKIILAHTQATDSKDWNYKEISEVAGTIFPIIRNGEGKDLAAAANTLEAKLKEFKNQEAMHKYLSELAEKAYQEKEKEIGEENMRQVEKFVSLRSVDALWMDHIDNMSHLRDSVRLRAYGQKDPLVEYKREGMRLFQRLLGSIQASVVSTIYKVALSGGQSQPERAAASEGFRGQQPSPQKTVGEKMGLPAEAQRAKVGRNSPCPCGATHPDGRPKKYKHCCGANR